MARLDVLWHANPKVLALGLPGMGLHAWSISYCDSQMTDGFIPYEALPNIDGVKTTIRVMLSSGRWKEVKGGYQLHDYLDYNRSRDAIAKERAQNADRKRSLRAGRGNGRG